MKTITFLKLLPLIVITAMVTSCGDGGSPSHYPYGTTTSPNSQNIYNSEEYNEQDPQSSNCPNDSCFYFSYDDSASTAAVEIVKYSLINNSRPDTNLGRPYEFLNFEAFDKSLQTNLGLFNVSMGVWTHDSLTNDSPQIHELGIHISSPEITLEQRENAVITLLVDVSGSMMNNYLYQTIDTDRTVQSRLDVVKVGLKYLYDNNLKNGDVINIVQFESDSSASDILLENWPYSVADNSYINTVSSLVTLGGTNLNAGISRAYQVANRTFDPTKTNRVIILTDAYANIGVVNSTVIANSTRINNQEGIYFSGLGIGYDFNEAFLNELTEAGKGGYASIVTPYDIRNIFGEKFIGLLNIAARDVQFRLDYPASLSHVFTASEELSTDQTQVKTINFSYNTSQFFLEGFEADVNGEIPVDPFILTITYLNESGETITETRSMLLSEIDGTDTGNIQQAYLITYLANLVGEKENCLESQTMSMLLPTLTSDLTAEYFDLVNRYCALE